MLQHERSTPHTRPKRWSSAAMRLWALQANGEAICLEVRAKMKGRELKKLIKEQKRTWDEFTCKTTVVEIVVGERWETMRRRKMQGQRRQML